MRFISYSVYRSPHSLRHNHIAAVFVNRRRTQSACIPSADPPPKNRSMPKPPLDPPVADVAPAGDKLTSYDREHVITYLRLLDADAEKADWEEVARIVLHIDPSQEPARARRAWESHLKRAKWMTEHGDRHLVRA